MAHILSWLRQPRAPEPGWNQESSLQAPGLRHECPCPGQAPALPLQVKTLLRPGAARAGDRLPQAAGQNGPRPSSAPKSSLEAWSTGLSCGETGGPGALQPQCQPFSQPLQEGAVAGWWPVQGWWERKSNCLCWVQVPLLLAQNTTNPVASRPENKLRHRQSRPGTTFPGPGSGPGARAPQTSRANARWGLGLQGPAGAFPLRYGNRSGSDQGAHPGTRRGRTGHPVPTWILAVSQTLTCRSRANRRTGSPGGP